MGRGRGLGGRGRGLHLLGSAGIERNQAHVERAQAAAEEQHEQRAHHDNHEQPRLLDGARLGPARAGFGVAAPEAEVVHRRQICAQATDHSLSPCQRLSVGQRQLAAAHRAEIAALKPASCKFGRSCEVGDKTDRREDRSPAGMWEENTRRRTLRLAPHLPRSTPPRCSRPVKTCQPSIHPTRAQTTHHNLGRENRGARTKARVSA